MSLKSLVGAGLTVLVLVVASGCNEQSKREIADPSPTVALALVPPTPTITLVEQVTATPIISVPTYTPVPTVTPLPLPSATPDTSVTLISPADFGDDRNPLTGELVPDPTILQRRPIAIKISNAPAKYTRPQSGLSQADLVFEHITEGWITRFTAVIFGQTPANIGPIRSARLIDLEIPAMYDAALAFSGSSIGVSRKLFGSDFALRILRPHENGYYRTGENKPYEHTLYAIPEKFWPVLEAKKENSAPVFNSNMTFTSDPPPGGQPAIAVNIKYRTFTNVDWIYDPESGLYLRWADGVEHTDANSGEQLSAANVVLILAPHKLDQTICEYQSGDKCRAYSMEIHLWGEGPAILLRDGQRYEARWKRASRNNILEIVSDLGTPIPLQIGNTWFQVIPIDHQDFHTTES